SWLPLAGRALLRSGRLPTGWPASCLPRPEPDGVRVQGCAGCWSRASVWETQEANGSRCPPRPEAASYVICSTWGTNSRGRRTRRCGSRPSRTVAELGLAEKVVRRHEALDGAGIPHAFGGALAPAY